MDIKAFIQKIKIPALAFLGVSLWLMVLGVASNSISANLKEKGTMFGFSNPVILPTGGSSSVPQLTQVINAGATATSTPTFSMGLNATTGTFTGVVMAQGVSSTNATTSFMTITSPSGNTGKINLTSSVTNCAGSAISCIRVDASNLAISPATGGNTYYGIDSTNGTHNFYGNVLPSANNARDLGTAAISWGNVYASGTAFLATVTSTNLMVSGNATTTGLAIGASASCGTLAASGGLRGIASPGTGFWINSGSQVQWCLNGNTSILFDPTEGLLQGLIAPLSTGTGSIGSLIRTYANAYIQNVSSTNLFINGQINLGTNNITNLGSATGSLANIYSSGTIFFVNATGTGTQISFPNLGAPSVSGNIVCFVTGSGRIGQQATNCTVSSAFFKEHIESLEPKELLAKALKLRAVSFDWKPGQAPKEGTNGGGTESAGFIAEEVAMVDPQLVSYTSDFTPEQLAFDKKNYPNVILVKDGKTLLPRTVDYARVTYVLTGALQAEDDRITALEERSGQTEGIWQKIKSLFN